MTTPAIMVIILSKYAINGPAAVIHPTNLREALCNFAMVMLFMIAPFDPRSLYQAREFAAIWNTGVAAFPAIRTLYAYFDARVPEPFLPRTLPPLRPASRACSLVNLCPVPSFCARL